MDLRVHLGPKASPKSQEGSKAQDSHPRRIQEEPGNTIVQSQHFSDFQGYSCTLNCITFSHGMMGNSRGAAGTHSSGSRISKKGRY